MLDAGCDDLKGSELNWDPIHAKEIGFVWSVALDLSTKFPLGRHHGKEKGNSHFQSFWVLV